MEFEEAMKARSEVQREKEANNPFNIYIDKAERYLEEGRDYESLSDVTFAEQRKQTLILGSIAASLIALIKKQ